MKKIVSLLAAAAMLFSCGVCACADDTDTNYGDQISLQYSYTQKVYSGISKSGNTVSCQSRVTGISGITTKITITQEIQKKSGTSWSSINGRGTTVFTSYANFSYSYSNLASGAYRVKTIAKVYSGSNYETITAYSRTLSV